MTSSFLSMLCLLRIVSMLDLIKFTSSSTIAQVLKLPLMRVSGVCKTWMIRDQAEAHSY